MIIWNAKDLIVFGLIAIFLLLFIIAYYIEKLMWWLESKNIISSKWRTKK